MLTIIQALIFIIDIVWFFVIAQVIMSWLIQFDVLNVRQPLVYQIWSMLNRILEPLYAPIRKVIPPMGGIEITPLVLLVTLFIAQRLLINNMALFA